MDNFDPQGVSSKCACAVRDITYHRNRVLLIYILIFFIWYIVEERESSSPLKLYLKTYINIPGNKGINRNREKQYISGSSSRSSRSSQYKYYGISIIVVEFFIIVFYYYYLYYNLNYDIIIKNNYYYYYFFIILMFWTGC